MLPGISRITLYASTVLLLPALHLPHLLNFRPGLCSSSFSHKPADRIDVIVKLLLLAAAAAATVAAAAAAAGGAPLCKSGSKSHPYL